MWQNTKCYQAYKEWMCAYPYFKIILIDYFTTRIRLYDMVMIKTLSVLGQVYLEGVVPCLKM